MVRMLTESPRRSARPAAAARHAPSAAHGARIVRVLLAAAVCALLAGCGTLYVWQAARGEWRLLHERVPIDTLLGDPHTPQALRAHLLTVRAAREFATRELKLPDNKSYRSYADI